MPVAPLTDLVAQLRDLAANPAEGVADADLLQRYVRDRDAVAFEALVWRHARLVMGVCRRVLRHHHDTEDAFQATFLLLARKASRLRRGNALSGWLHTTALRVALRARKRRGVIAHSELLEQPTSDVPAETREAQRFLDEEIRRLPVRLRTTFILCELEGRTHADAARELGCPKGTIDSRMAAANRRLRVALTRRGVTLTSTAVLVAAVPELARCEVIRRATVLGNCRKSDLSPAVAELLVPAERNGWLVSVAVVLAVAVSATIAGFSSLPGDPPSSPADRPGDGPKATERAPATELQLPATRPLFKRTTIGLPPEDDFNRDEWRPARDIVAGWYARVLKERQDSGRPMIPPAVPVGHDDFVTFMTDRTVSCYLLKPTELLGHQLKAGDIAWAGELDGGLLQFAHDLGPRTLVNTWIRNAKPETRCDAFFHRTLSTSVSVSDGYGHTVDESAIVPLDGVIGPDSDPALRIPMGFNMIKAWDLESGKLSMRLPDGNWDSFPKKPKGFVLSAPLSKDDHWYLVCEMEGKFRVRCFAWKKFAKLRQTREPNRIKDSTIWDTELTRPPNELWKDLHRRIHAIHLVLAGHLALCPTHLGRVVAVDSKTGTVQWTHEYAPLDSNRFPTFAPEWIVVPPVVAGDKYVYAPADFPELLCLNVADGKKVWSVKKGDGLYPAVVGDQVLVIGEKTVRSLNLKDGSERWKLDLPGLPCGRGAVLGETYLVPVSEPKTWRGMIAVVDLKAGKIAEVLKPEKEEPIGNLVVHQEFLISQTLTEIAVFPIRKKE